MNTYQFANHKLLADLTIGARTQESAEKKARLILASTKGWKLVYGVNSETGEGIPTKVRMLK